MRKLLHEAETIQSARASYISDTQQLIRQIPSGTIRTYKKKLRKYFGKLFSCESMLFANLL